VLGELYPHNPLERIYGHRHGTRCRECQTFRRPVLIAPTHRKDYRNPHIAQVWYQAEQSLRLAEKAIFIGYSLPDDDVEVIYLLKRSLGHLQPSSFTVVEYAASQPAINEHPVGSRYRTLFDNEVNWRTEGFAAYVDSLRQ
jgi:hypothetical protein